MSQRSNQERSGDNAHDSGAASPGKELSLDEKAADLGLDVGRSVRSALQEIKALLDARYVTSQRFPPKEEQEAFDRWRSVSRALDLHVGEELFFGPTLALRSGEELNQLSDAIGDAAHLRWVTPSDAEKLKLIDDRIAKGGRISPSERDALQLIRYQVRERKEGEGCISEGEEKLLDDLGARLSRPNLRSLGLQWVVVSRDDRAVIEPAPSGGRYEGTSLRRLTSHFFNARMRMLNPERSESERAAYGIFAAGKQAAQAREHGYHQQSAEAWDRIIADLREKYPPGAER